MLYGLDADAAKTLLSTLHLRFRKPAYTRHCSTSSISFRSPSRHVTFCIIDGSNDPDVDAWRKRQPRADEFQPSVLTHEVARCDHPGTERNQK
jgi:hypothetical protein